MNQSDQPKASNFRRVRLWFFGFTLVLGLVMIILGGTADAQETSLSFTRVGGFGETKLQTAFYLGILLAVFGGVGVVANMPDDSNKRHRNRRSNPL